MERNKLNLTFHKIVYDECELKNRYDCTFDFAIKLIESVKNNLNKKNIELVIFLDDGYRSQYEFAKDIINTLRLKVNISVISENIGICDYISEKDIAELKKIGVDFCSHGVSHVALGRYENGIVLATPKKGIYKNFPRGHGNLLPEEGVRFQVIESIGQLERLGLEVSSFVYPYGICNDSIKKIVKESNSYRRAYICEDGLENEDADPFAIPRFLVYNDVSIDNFLARLERVI